MRFKLWLLLLLVLPVTSTCADCSAPVVGDIGAHCVHDEDCGEGLHCSAGQCLQCDDQGDCQDGEVCLDGQCYQDCADANRCERGGDCCPGNYDCVQRSCLPPCAEPRCGVDGTLCCGSNGVCDDNVCRIDCGARERCGASLDMCCADGELCYGQVCTAQGAACTRQADCETDQVCEVDLGICIDRAAVGNCEYHPPPGVFSPQPECRWSADPQGLTPNRSDVVMTPLVANLSDDNGDGHTDIFDTPDIIFTSYDFASDGCCNVDGTLRIISGRCKDNGVMQEIASIDTPALDNSAGLAIGDLDGDGLPEIVAMLNNSGHPQGCIAFKRASDEGSQWDILWQNNEQPSWNVHSRGGAQPSLVDLDLDGFPEVIIGNVALSGLNGQLLWDGVVTSGGNGGIGNNAFLGPVSTAADINLDGFPEILAGNSCYSHTGEELWTYDFSSNNSPCGGQLPCDGYTATANFDDDDEGEVVIVRRGEVYILNDDGSLLFSALIPVDDCPNNEGGPPTIADFDGDGRAEIGTAAGDFYAVIDPDCVGTPLPEGCSDQGVLWAVPNQDCSSRVTASSVFDFDGDGRAEVVYADETSLRIFDGRNGDVLFSDDSHHSHTRLEMAVIADVDNDGNSEVIIPENGYHGGTPGLVVWGDSDDNWVYTRRIWNQHSYHVSNISQQGIVPSPELPDWLQPGLNNFRQNTQGEGLFFAPDLVVLNSQVVCRSDLSIHINFDIMNQGSRMVGAGVAISIYRDDEVLDTVTTSRVLFPGQSEAFVWDWPIPEDLYYMPLNFTISADDLGQGQGAQNECEDGGEDNNSVTAASIVCGPEG